MTYKNQIKILRGRGQDLGRKSVRGGQDFGGGDQDETVFFMTEDLSGNETENKCKSLPKLDG